MEEWISGLGDECLYGFTCLHDTIEGSGTARNFTDSDNSGNVRSYGKRK